MSNAASVLLGLAVTSLVQVALAGDASQPRGEPALEAPTLHCLGVWWIISGDDNANARVEVAYRSDRGRWLAGPALFRVEKGASRPGKRRGHLEVPPGAWLFAGSLVGLKPAAAYEVKLALIDPDGGKVEKILTAGTLAEPAELKGMRVRHVVPGVGGGTGGKDAPFRGLAAAQAQARPGDVLLLRAGVYEGTFNVTASGKPGQPIIWRGAGDGGTVIDAQGSAAKRPGCAVAASDVHDVWFEKLTVRNARFGIVAHRSTRIVVRRCHIHSCEYGLTCTGNQNDRTGYFFISDNVIEGPSTWPRTKGIENARGIQVTGVGHVICYNRIRGFADAIDTFGSQRCEAIDIHNNDISEMTDDGIEMDYSQRNTRCFNNRLTNVFQGISVQPVYGGPVYVFRNAMYNVGHEAFKMHNSPSGALFFHNTSVKKGMPLILYAQRKVRNCVTRNNLFLGTAGNYAYETTAPMVNCDFDYDGFGGGPWKLLLKWNTVRYKTLADVHARAPVYRHAVLVDPKAVFASGVLPPTDVKKRFAISVNDLRLKAGSQAIDAGAALPGFNDGCKGQAPDLGAYELGAPLPHYGPRPEKD